MFAPHLTDFYKCGHINQFPKGTELVYCNMTARSDKYAQVLPDFDHKIVFFGLQGVCQSLLIELWNETFFFKPIEEVLRKYKRRMDHALGIDVVKLEHIEALHKLGYLPLLIKALPEGSRVGIRVPFYTIQNTKPEFYWLTNYVESQMSAELWQPMVTATIAYEFRRLANKFGSLTGVSPDFIPFQCHDFSFRGMEDVWGATKSGAGHLLSFLGTDTVSAIDYLEDYYPDSSDPFIGGSVPATEHAVMCMGGKLNEMDTYRRLIHELYPTGIISIVSDTWDFWHMVDVGLVKLRDEILARDGKVVIRPDSGDPVKTIVGDPEAPEGSVEFKGCVERAWEIFGGVINSMGFKDLDPHIGFIYGDSINLDRATRIFEGLKAKGFSSGNIVLGVGSYTYQYVTRDTFGNAIKATAGQVNGEFRAIFKDPKTDIGSIKKSLQGFIRIELENGNFVPYDNQSAEQEKQGELKEVFRNGQMIRMQSLMDVRNNLKNS